MSTGITFCDSVTDTSTVDSTLVCTVYDAANNIIRVTGLWDANAEYAAGSTFYIKFYDITREDALVKGELSESAIFIEAYATETLVEYKVAESGKLEPDLRVTLDLPATIFTKLAENSACNHSGC